jgi:hypothetical protein
MAAFGTTDERRTGTAEEGGRMPLVSSTGLFWSLRGAVLCTEHAAQVDRQAWLMERWEALPETSQGFHGARYQCQKCSPYGTALVHASDRHAADGRSE